MRLALLLTLALALPAIAQQSPDFPASRSYIIQLTSRQAGSGMGDYLVPPLARAMKKAGLRYRGDAGAEFVATVEAGSDIGRWHGSGADRRWLYQRFLTVGLSPASVDVEPEGKLSPSFAVTVLLTTPDEDRVDELDCLIALATRELAARYRLTGKVKVDGSGCARKSG